MAQKTNGIVEKLSQNYILNSNEFQTNRWFIIKIGFTFHLKKIDKNILTNNELLIIIRELRAKNWTNEKNDLLETDFHNCLFG